MEEIFMDIPGYEGLYQASTLGRIKSYPRPRTKGGILKQELCKGYLRCNFSKNGQTKRIQSHRLIAQTFIPNSENKPQVNHIDGNKLNNCVNNLEWVTASENTIHSYHILGTKSIFNTNHPSKGMFGRKHWNSIPIIQYTLDGVFIKERGAMMDIERGLGIPNNCICSCCKGRYKTSGGYVWRYKLSIDN